MTCGAEDRGEGKRQGQSVKGVGVSLRDQKILGITRKNKVENDAWALELRSLREK